MEGRQIGKADAIGDDLDRKLTGDQQLRSERASQLVLDLQDELARLRGSSG